MLVSPARSLPAIDQHLLKAAHGGHVAEMAALLDQGADIHAFDSPARETPLHLAAGCGRARAVQLLLERGADLERRNDFAWTPLHRAVHSGDLPTVHVLLDRKAALEPRDRRLWTPLHWAAADDRVAVMADLLSRGASIQAKDQEGATPLHTAANKSGVEALLVLVDHGADVDVRDHAQRTPLRYAVLGRNSETILTLRACGAGPLSDLDSLKPTPSIRRQVKLDAVHAAAELGHLGLLDRALVSSGIESLPPRVRARRFHAIAKHARERKQPDVSGYLQARLARQAIRTLERDVAGIRPL